MSTPTTSERDGEQGDEHSDETVGLESVTDAVAMVQRSAILFTTVVGLMLVAIGASPLLSGVFAGMFGVWGATLLAVAAVAFVSIKVLKAFD